jgi:selenocysteine lyase/cysteine desulfurase
MAEPKWVPAVERTRGLVAELLHAGMEEVAFTRNTSQGLNIVAASVPC